MSTQLWAWEYEGNTEVGYQSTDNSYIFKAIDVLEMRHKAYLHNLRKVKVVDEDAVVIDAIPLSIIQLAVQEGIDGINEWQRKTYPRPDEAVKARGALHAISQIVRGYSITPIPPVTEPKGVISGDGLWIHNGREWVTRYAMWKGKPLKTKEDWDAYDQEMIDLGYRLVADEEQMKVTYRTLYGGESKAYLDGDPVGHIYRGTNKHSDEDVLIASVPTSDPELNAWVEIPVPAAIVRGEG